MNDRAYGRSAIEPREVARVMLPTPLGTFDVRAFQGASGFTYLALVAGNVRDGGSVLARVHSECLTGDALGSLRCDCGVQLRESLRAIAAEGRGVLVYATGHEGRGIGLLNKLRAYVEQDRGSDTVDANLHLGLPVDGRDYREAAGVLTAVGVTSVVLITNNPRKVDGLRAAGITIEEVRHLPVAAHTRNVRYLETKRERLGHAAAASNGIKELRHAPPDVSNLLGQAQPRPARPYTVLKYAQSVDGRIATEAGDSKWISGDAERKVTHALRARCDAIMVGVGTVLTDDPQLTVRLVPGASPVRVILDSTLRIPLSARVLDDAALTLVVTTDGADQKKAQALRDHGVGIRFVRRGTGGVDVRETLVLLRSIGIATLLVEGGARVITSLLDACAADRVIVALAPVVLGRGIEGVGDLGIERVADGVALSNRSLQLAGDDILIGWDVGRAINGNGAPD